MIHGTSDLDYFMKRKEVYNLVNAIGMLLTGNRDMKVDYSRLRIGMVGALPPPLGGVTVLFEHLIRTLENMPGVRIELALIPIGDNSLANRVLRTLYVVGDVIKMLPKIDVLTLHVPTMVLPVLGPLCYLLARISGKAFVLRKFGGTDYTCFGWLARTLSIWVVNRAAIYLAEAEALVKIAQSHGARNACWYPNNRPFDGNTISEDLRARRCQKFVYVGQVRRKKGILELAEAADKQELDEPVDIYGPFYDGITEDTFRQFRNVRYRGVLNPLQVTATLREYDALVLPTYHEGEGYPGVILEAYCAGLPVICSRWRFLPEIVSTNCGILVSPHDVNALCDAMLRLRNDIELFGRLRIGARKQAEKFKTVDWAQKFVALCLGAVN